MGPDRWAALIGAHHLSPGNRVVVNVGTAMTVDALTAQGDFLGGMILPGVRLMQKALNTNTAHLPLSGGHYDPFPKKTVDAIYTGLLTALASSVDTMARRMIGAGHSAGLSCVVSGGDAKMIVPYLAYPAIVVNELVLHGLTVIAEQEAFTGKNSF
jgi:type III pantothenate kinase